MYQYIAAAATLLALYKAIRFATTDCDTALMKCSLPPGFYQDKVVWVTGASSGIGEALALRLSQLGAKLVLSSRKRDALEAVKQKCGGGDRIQVVPLDLGEVDALAGKAAEALRCFGRIDVLINNGGVSTRALAHETDFSVDKKVALVDYLGQVACTKALLPHLMERKTGIIINISSIAGKVGGPLRSAYSGAKFALLGWMDSLRCELRGLGIDGIKVCNICPGPVATNVATNALTKDGTSFARADKMIDQGISPQRCAELVLTAAANGREESWICRHPYLLFTYVAQYMPGVMLAISSRVARKQLKDTGIRE